MATPVDLLLQLGVILLGGVLLSLFAQRFRIPELLLFILFGFGLSQLSFQGVPLFAFTSFFITSVSLLALAVIVFEGSANFRFWEVDALGLATLKLIGLNLIFHLALFTGAAVLLGFTFGMSALIAGILLGTSAPVVLNLLGPNAKGQIFELLKLESVLNTPINVIIPFVVLDIMAVRAGGPLDVVLAQFEPFLLNIFVGIGAGVVSAIILFKIFGRFYEKLYSPLGLLIAAILTYALSEKLGGSGVLSVTALGMVFGNMYLKEKARAQLMEVQSVFSRSLYILLFVLFGTIIAPIYSWSFLAKGLILSGVYFVGRGIAVSFALGSAVPFKTKLFMIFTSPNGASAVAVAAFVGGSGLPGIEELVALAAFVVVFQILVASAMVRFREQLVPEQPAVRKTVPDAIPSAAEEAPKKRKKAAKEEKKA